MSFSNALAKASPDTYASLEAFTAAYPGHDLNAIPVIEALMSLKEPPRWFQERFVALDDGLLQEWLQLHTPVMRGGVSDRATLVASFGQVGRRVRSLHRSERNWQNLHKWSLLVRAGLWFGARPTTVRQTTDLLQAAGDVCWVNPYYALFVVRDYLRAGIDLKGHDCGRPNPGTQFAAAVLRAIDKREEMNQPLSDSTVEEIEACIADIIGAGVSIAERGFAFAAGYRVALAQRAIDAGCDPQWILAAALLAKKNAVADLARKHGAQPWAKVGSIHTIRYGDTNRLPPRGEPLGFFWQDSQNGARVSFKADAPSLSSHKPVKWTSDDAATVVRWLKARSATQLSQIVPSRYRLDVPQHRISKEERLLRAARCAAARRCAAIAGEAGVDLSEPEAMVLLASIGACELLGDQLDGAADIDAPDGGRTPLAAALECDQLDAARLLIERGARLGAPLRSEMLELGIGYKVRPALAHARSKGGIQLMLSHTEADQDSRDALFQLSAMVNPPSKAVSLEAARAFGIRPDELERSPIKWTARQREELEAIARSAAS